MKAGREFLSGTAGPLRVSRYINRKSLTLMVLDRLSDLLGGCIDMLML